MKKPSTVNEYIVAFPANIQEKLQQIRETVKMAAPEAEEVISYGIPCYKLPGPLLWFAAYKNHIGMYPIYDLEALQEEMVPYVSKSAKSSLHFAHGRPLPLVLISKIVNYRAEKNLEKKA